MIYHLLFAHTLLSKSIFDRSNVADESKKVVGSSIGPEDLSPEKQCEAAIYHYTETCPGFQAIDIVSSNSTDVDALRRFCPCVSAAARREHAEMFAAMDRTCGTAYATSISYLSNVMCAQTESGEYCGSKITELNDAFAHITKLFNTSNNQLTAADRATLQKKLGDLCGPGFDKVSAGLVRWLSEVNAAGTTANPGDSEEMSEIGLLIGKLLDSRILCARNDNAQQVQAGEPFCVPWLLGEMLPLGSGCMTRKGKEKGECLKNDECVWYSGTACGSIVDHFTDTSTYAHLPPTAISNSTSSNRCFLTIQNIVHVNKVILADAAVPGHPNAKIADDMQKASKALDAVSANAWLTDGTSSQSCLSRWRSYNFSGLKKSCTAKEMDSFQTGAKVKLGSQCAAALKTVIEDFGCCFGTLRELQKALDPAASMLPNFGLMEKACGKSSTSPCNPYGNASPKLSLIAHDLRCSETRQSNRKAVHKAIHSDVAAHLGVPIDAVRNVEVTHADGASCSQTREVERDIRVRFSVSLADDGRRDRVVAACTEQSPVLLPTANYIVKKDAELEKRLNTLMNQRSAPLNTKYAYLSYKRWVISLCIIVLLLAIAVCILLMWREKITFVWCWTCQVFLRRRARRQRASVAPTTPRK